MCLCSTQRRSIAFDKAEFADDIDQATSCSVEKNWYSTRAFVLLGTINFLIRRSRPRHL